MKLALLDSLSIPGDPSKPNDDAMAHDEHAAVVFDGATGLGENLMPGNSDAAWLATFGSRRLMAHLRDGDAPKDAVRAAMSDAEHSYKALRRRDPKENYEIPFASMMLAVLTGDGLDMLWFGDCAMLVKRPDGAVELVGDAMEKREGEARRAARLAEKHGLSPATSINRPQILDALRNARNHVNTDGHWAFGPDVRAADHVSGKTLNAPSGTLLLLCSDGFLALASDYNAYNADGLLQAVQTKGLKALAEELRGIENADPGGLKFPRFKTSDDATALLLRLL